MKTFQELKDEWGAWRDFITAEEFLTALVEAGLVIKCEIDYEI